MQGSILNLEVKTCTYNGDESKFYFNTDNFNALKLGLE